MCVVTRAGRPRQYDATIGRRRPLLAGGGEQSGQLGGRALGEAYGGHGDVEQRQDQVARLVDGEVPAGAGELADRDHAEAPVAGADHRLQPVDQVVVGDSAEHEVLRCQVGPARQPAGQHVLALRSGRSASRPVTRAARSSTTVKLLVGDVGEHRRQLEGVHQLVVGPRRGHQLDGQRGDHLAGDGVRTADRRRATDRLEVDQHVGAVVVAADAHQPRVRRAAERPLVGLRGLAIEPPAATVLERDPGRRRVGSRGRDAELDLVVVDRHRVDRRQRRLPSARGTDGQAPQRSVDALGTVGVGADEQRDLGLDAARSTGRRPGDDVARRRARRARVAASRPPPSRSRRSSPSYAVPSTASTASVCSLGAVDHRHPVRASRPSHRSASCSRGLLLDLVRTHRVIGQHQHPAGLDQPADAPARRRRAGAGPC